MASDIQDGVQASGADPPHDFRPGRKERVVNSLLAAAAVVVLAQAYQLVIVPHFNFGGFQLEPSAFPVSLAAVLVGALAGLSMPAAADTPSALFLWIQFGFTVVPAAVLVSLGGGDPRTLLFSIMGVLGVRAAQAAIRGRVSAPEPGVDPDSRVVRVSWVLLLLVLLALVISVRGAWNLALGDVYAAREESREAIPFVLQYLVPMTGMGLLPFLVAVALWRRRALDLALLLALGLAFFAFSSHKGMVFYPLAVLAGWLIARRPSGHRWVLLSITGIAVASLAIELASTSDDGIGAWLTALSLHRIIFLPVQIMGYYIDYFSTHPHLYWAESKITLGLLKTGLGMDAAQFIGEEYFRAGTVANSGWISTGYMNGGVVGLLVYAGFVGWLYAFVDARAAQIGRTFAVGVFIVPVATLMLSADPLATLLTHGLAVVLVLTSLYARAPGAPDST
jgi:hypothetical protein